MAEHDISGGADERAVRAFTRAILADIRALEMMIERGQLERGVQRVGVEQEMFLVDAHGFAAPKAVELMRQLEDDPHFQSEVARFNLEANLDPQPLDGEFLTKMESQLDALLERARRAARSLDIDIVLTGILPTLRSEDVTPANLTPESRYQRLDQASMAAQDGHIHLTIDGIDRFESRFDSVVVEGANTSIQLHLQVSPDEAAQLYNLAQLITAPCLAAATNSPVLLGKRVWHETRVAVFERAFDDRSASQLSRGVPTRVGFGSGWVRDSLVELFRDNVARYQVIMTREVSEDPLAALERGEIPRLRALCLHNGTVWRWNRPCYGVTGGRPHLRIENRALPAGPTVLDEIANAALFYGLMTGLHEDYADVADRLSFAEARRNFLASAHRGLEPTFTWLDGRRIGVRELLLQELIPAARDGLAAVGVPSAQIARYLDVVEARVESQRTGASWLLDGLARVDEAERPRICVAAVHAMREHVQAGPPVHEWSALDAEPVSGAGALTLGDIMSRDVFTVRPDDVIDLATTVMGWKHIRHVPVEDARGRLVGLLTARELLRLREGARDETDAVRPVREFMLASPPMADPGLDVIEGMRRLLANETGCLLIVRGQHLAGIVTERDLVKIAHRLLTETETPA